MIDIPDLLLTAERELASSDILARTTQAGILFGILTEAVRKYTRTPVSPSEVVALMTILVRDGKLLESLPQDAHPRTPDVHNVTTPERRTRDEENIPTPDRRLTPERDREREEDIRVMRANGYSDSEIEAILALQDAAVAGTEVISRTDADLAEHEEEKGNPFPGVPKGLRLRPNGIVSDFTMTPSEPLPSDLTK